ncbi:phospholipase D/nuclease [Trichocladium antarcticum]|uniref:Phospholipase D/nuclease n=1 Tax=Trichocladium antarcticum TaxID=1450529 RepID=A0AAN6UKQ1_9PEZI|nr:phospholipase D/nuclease [Trichocladium antarcticum]
MTEPRQPFNSITDGLVQLCTSDDSVSALVAQTPSLAPGDAWEQLYGKRAVTAAAEDEEDSDCDCESTASDLEPVSQDELQRAARCGKWGPTKPSDLFLRIYHDALATLNEDPQQAVVSPSLMGSHGTVPLTVISVLPDIVRHMSNVIVRAERDVFLATNYWQDSVASKYITDAIRELDRRAGARGTRIVLKIIYDRGTPKQLFTPHHIVPDKDFTGKNVNLPQPSEIPNIDMEVMNFHSPLMGTFHAKYMLVDRKIALLQSNNIQDNDNLEMMVHLEGPIVDSLYDMALISWHRQLDPPLPTYNAPAARGGIGVPTNGAVNGGPAAPNPAAASAEGAAIADPPPQASTIPEHTADDPHYDDDIAGEVARVQASLAPKPTETHLQAVTRLLNHTVVSSDFPGDPAAPACPPGELMTPYIAHRSAATPYPMALVNRPPYGKPTHRSVSNPQNAAWLSALRNAQHSVLILSPTLNARPLIHAIRAACARGVDVRCYISLGYNDAGELLPRQGGHNEGVAAALHAALPPAARRRLHYHWYVAKDQARPIPQARGRRSSHVKLMVVDGRVGIQGNGNQDTQSWFHSQEVNVMVDSEAVCREWVAGLERNQNTAVFGRVGAEDGVWRDAAGEEAEGAMGAKARGALLKGVVGAVNRVRGTGGF